MDYDELDISQLAPGASINGLYRGRKVHRVPAFQNQPETVLARVFLETGGGPRTVQVDERAITQLDALEVGDGDDISISKESAPAEGYVVTRRGN